MSKNKYPFLHTIPELSDLLNRAPKFHFADKIEQLVDLSCGDCKSNSFEVMSELPDSRLVTEATVVRVKNGIAVNYIEPYMRRRDPDCMVIGDDKPSEKPSYESRFGTNFSDTRTETLEWLASQELAVFAFRTGNDSIGYDALAVTPVNSAFFALGLAMLQGILSLDQIGDNFDPKTVLYVAPTFRHTHFDGKQIVVHNRLDECYEIFSYNLYPGPSAKKGVYGVLINEGEHAGWVVPHCSAVQVVTPYDNQVNFMHEGASGGGKSEMLERPHRLPDGRLLKGYNPITKERRYIEIMRTCDLHPLCDDMALCHPTVQNDDGYLSIIDAENGWFLRVNHIDQYGTDPTLEKLTLSPPEPLFFLNIDAVPNGHALIWEHHEDAPGIPCPNPRVIVPREIYPGIITEPLGIHYRSFGVRTPPCTRKHPSYGIIGMLHILPPALAWLWRLVAPRGYGNPSILDTEEGMSSEGVGSYWAFSTGLKVNQANLLLEQIQEHHKTRYILTPNQHIGVWETGFMPQWLTREYLARRGTAPFRKEQLVSARNPLLGYALSSMRIEGYRVSHWFLRVELQPEVGFDGYDAGSKILQEFFAENLKQFLKPDLHPLGHQIIECFLNNGSVKDYEDFFPDHELYT